MKNKLQQLKEVIQKANPSKVWKVECESNQCDAFFTDPIRLADVLIAIVKESQLDSGTKEFDAIHTLTQLQYKKGTFISNRLWNLTDDNLNNQSEETIKFLTDLLV